MNNVMCLICGRSPKIVNSDGNAKDCIKVTKNMIYDFKDESEPMELHDFKTKLIISVFKSAFFQNEPKVDINMLKLPLIIAPALIGHQVNNDILKDSLLDEKIKHSSESLHELGMSTHTQTLLCMHTRHVQKHKHTHTLLSFWLITTITITFQVFVYVC